MNRVWIVEMWMDSMKRPVWHPTVGAALSRYDSKDVLDEWRKKNPYDKFRVRCYAAEQASSPKEK